jgi:hypothetical protein
MMQSLVRKLILVSALAIASTWSPAQLFHPATAEASSARFWIEPTDIETRNLYFGPGGEQGQPHGLLTFVVEDPGGTSPKFEVRDEDGTKWKAKLGPEAQPETVAARILWAVGFIANQNYYLPITMIQNMPHLKRGQEFVTNEGVRAVRLQRTGARKIGNWSWQNKEFKGSRQFNGLRVMMALLSNWDLNERNNAILDDPKDSDHPLYQVSDLGATFGRSGKSYSDRITKHNLAAYRRSKFISKTTPDHVDFAFPTHPPFLYGFNLPFFIGKMRNHWVGKHIPREDAKWVGTLLAKLSDQQIQDAFRAGGYSPTEIDQYTAAVRSRIAELEKL